MTPKAREMARTVVFLIVQVQSDVALSKCTTPSETVMVSFRGLGWFMSDTIYEITLSHKSKYSKYAIKKCYIIRQDILTLQDGSWVS